MNIQRFVWIVMTLLFGAVGAVGGFFLGQYYIDFLLPHIFGSSAGGIGAVVPFVISLGLLIVGARFGVFFADRVILAGLRQTNQFSAADRVLGITGALLGLLFGVLITIPLPNDKALFVGAKFCVMLLASAIGMALLGGMRAEMLRVFPQLEEEKPGATHGARAKFLDTNIIIDGRLNDLCKTGFIEGPIYIPTFVLEEVQHIADSSDSIRRARGRRGLDVLNAMKELSEPNTVNGQSVLVPVVHVLGEFSAQVNKIHAVDSKLVQLAREREGVIITNDFNLNKVAELQGVRVLNLNELAQAIKPVVLPGEEMQITLVKEGKEPTQGVGYLEDGTMVVVTDAYQHIGETCAVIIATVYQTVAGKMIFAELRDKDKEPAKPSMRGTGDDLFGDANRGGDKGGRNGDDYGNRSGGGMRRKSRT